MSFDQVFSFRLLHVCGFFVFIGISGNCGKMRPRFWMWTLQIPWYCCWNCGLGPFF